MSVVTATRQSSRASKRTRHSDDEDEATVTTVDRKRVSKPTARAQANKASSLSNNASTKTCSDKKDKSNDKSEKPSEDLRVWVECDRCGKWRALPSTVDSSKLPDIWFCELNTYDDVYNSCDKPEEVSNDTVNDNKDLDVTDTNELKTFCGYVYTFIESLLIMYYIQ